MHANNKQVTAFSVSCLPNAVEACTCGLAVNRHSDPIIIIMKVVETPKRLM